MDNRQNDLQRIEQVVIKGGVGAILLPINPTIDAIASATSLYLGLTKLGKNVSLSCSSSVQIDLTGADKIQNKLAVGGDNLVISFPYSDGAVDKVDYNIQGNTFNLIIAPRTGYSKINPNQISYSYSGGKLDFIIVIDSPTLQNLGNLYTNNQKQFEGLNIINIDRHLSNSFYGTVNFVNKTSSSVSELVFIILKSLQLEIDRDIATNLYAGIAAATNNFTSYSTNADTFEIIAQLLRLGAIKKSLKKPQSVSFQPSSFNPLTSSFEPTPIEAVEKEPQPKKPSETPQDWLKPKIFRGGGLI